MAIAIRGKPPAAAPPRRGRDTDARGRLDRRLHELIGMVVELGGLVAVRGGLLRRLDDPALGTPAQRARAHRREAALAGEVRGLEAEAHALARSMEEQWGRLSARGRRHLEEDWGEDIGATGGMLAALRTELGVREPRQRGGGRNGTR